MITEDFNKRIFSSDETKEEKEFLIKEVRLLEAGFIPEQASSFYTFNHVLRMFLRVLQVKEIFSSYFDTAAVDRINFDPEIVKGLQACKFFSFEKLYLSNVYTYLRLLLQSSCIL